MKAGLFKCDDLTVVFKRSAKTVIYLYRGSFTCDWGHTGVQWNSCMYCLEINVNNCKMVL